MLEALFERRVRPDMLVAKSVGTINAAFVASRPPSVRTAHELQRSGGASGAAMPFPPIR